MPDFNYPVYDADNHFYEPEEAITGHLPKRFRKEFRYVEVNGRKDPALIEAFIAAVRAAEDAEQVEDLPSDQ